MAYKRNWFSNFVQMDEPLAEDGVAYWTVENYYQAMKTLNEIHRKQIAGMSAAKAKKAGRKVELRPNWEEVKLSVMEKALKHKFQEGTSQHKKLMETGSEEIVEQNYWHDNYWGQCTCPKCSGRKGQNILGKMLMQIRSECTAKKDFKVIVAGSRTFNDSKMAFEKLDKLLKEKLNTHRVVIVSGAARGADTLGEEWAAKNYIRLAQFPAKWDEHGKSAGYKRNMEMAKYADALVAFWDKKSRGTKHMIDIMKELGKPVRIINYGEAKQ